MSSIRQGDKRFRILRAAVKVFAKNGFHNSRISEIAREAEVASGTIYLYFRNKDDILINVFEESLDDIIRDMEKELGATDDPRLRVKLFIRRHLKLMKEHRELAEVLQVELRQSYKFMKEYEPKHWIKYLNIIARIFKEGQEKGLFREDLSLGVTKRALFGALDEIALHWVLTKKDEKYLDAAAEQLARMVLEGVATRNGSS